MVIYRDSVYTIACEKESTIVHLDITTKLVVDRCHAHIYIVTLQVTLVFKQASCGLLKSRGRVAPCTTKMGTLIEIMALNTSSNGSHVLCNQRPRNIILY